MKKKNNPKINSNLNEENTNNLFLPSTSLKNENNLENKNNIKKGKTKNIFSLPKKVKIDSNNIVNNNSKNKILKDLYKEQKNEMVDDDIQTIPKKGKNKKNKFLNELKINQINTPKIGINPIIINEVKNNKVPKLSKKKKCLNFLYIFFIYRRKAYPLNCDSNSTIKDIFKKLSEELNIEKNLLEFRINEKIIQEEEKLIKDLIEEEKTDKIYVTKLFPNHNMINNLYNKAYNNFVIIENLFEIKDIEQKLNKFLEEYHMEKDYYFNKINDNKYSFGFSCPDFAFDFNRILLILKRTENDFKDIKSHLKIIKKKNK